MMRGVDAVPPACPCRSACRAFTPLLIRAAMLRLRAQRTLFTDWPVEDADDFHAQER